MNKHHESEDEKNHEKYKNHDYKKEPLHLFPLATFALMLVLIGTFILQNLFVNSNAQLLGSLMTTPEHLLEGNYFSIVTSIFLHGNIVHLFFNLIALYLFGRVVEKHYGLKLIFIFLGAGVIANVISHVLSLYFGDLFYSLGASGAIAGLIIFAVLSDPFSTEAIPLVPIPLFIIGWALIVIDLVGLSNPSQVNHLAHIGGYLALTILFFFLGNHHKKKLVIGLIINVLVLVGLLILFSVLEISIIKELGNLFS